jgi:uncharacterized membrane protein
MTSSVRSLLVLRRPGLLAALATGVVAATLTAGAPAGAVTTVTTTKLKATGTGTLTVNAVNAAGLIVGGSSQWTIVCHIAVFGCLPSPAEQTTLWNGPTGSPVTITPAGGNTSNPVVVGQTVNDAGTVLQRVSVGGTTRPEVRTSNGTTALLDPSWVPVAINNAGQALLDYTDANGNLAAGTWANGVASPLGPLQTVKPLPPSSATPKATALSDTGVGTGIQDGLRAVLLQHGKAVRLPIPTGWTTSTADKIDPTGNWVIGTISKTGTDGFPVTHGVVWHGTAPADVFQGTVTDLGLLPGGGELHPLDVNSAGQVVGWGTIAPVPNQNLHTRAFLWQSGKLQQLPGKGGDAIATAINASGVVVGSDGIPDGGPYGYSNFRAAAWVKGALVDLGSSIGAQATSSAVDVNDKGLAVGDATTASGTESVWAWQITG